MRQSWTVSRVTCALFIFAQFLLAFFSFALSAGAQGTRKDDIVLNRFGQPVAGATITVCTAGATGTPCSPLAAIYSNVTLTTTKTNPMASDGQGNYNFYAAPGRYMLQFSGAGVTTTTIPDVILPCDPTNCSASSISVTNGISAFSLTLSGNLSVSGTVTTGSLNPTSINTTQAGAAPAQVGPYWYPGTSTGVCTPPALAPTVAVDNAAGGSIGTGTFFYKVAFVNLNGETLPGPATTFAASSGATNKIILQVNASDTGWQTGCYGYRTYVSSDNVNFFRQTGFPNEFSAQAGVHWNPGVVILSSITLAGAGPAGSNTATIDADQVALNTSVTNRGALIYPAGDYTTTTTPLLVPSNARIMAAGKASLDNTSQGSTRVCAFLNGVVELGCVMIFEAQGVDTVGLNVKANGTPLMLFKSSTGAAFSNVIKYADATLEKTGTTGTAIANIKFKGRFFYVDMPRLQLKDGCSGQSGQAAVLFESIGGSGVKFAGEPRWTVCDKDDMVRNTPGVTDFDHGINHPGFINAMHATFDSINLQSSTSGSGNGVFFNTPNMGLIIRNFSVSDYNAAVGTPALIQIGCDANCGGGVAKPLIIENTFASTVLGSPNAPSTIKVLNASGGSPSGIYLTNSQVFGSGASSVAIDRNSLGIPIVGINETQLRPDPLAVTSTIINPPTPGSGADGLYFFNAQGVADGISGAPQSYSEMGKLVIKQASNRTRRRTLNIDPIGAALFQILAGDDATVDASDDLNGNWVMRGTLTWNGGNKISKVLQSQTTLTFGAIAAQTCGNQTVTLTGAATTNGAFASPNYAVEAGLAWSAFVSAANTVTVRACNVTSASITPTANSNWRVWVVQE